MVALIGKWDKKPCFIIAHQDEMLLFVKLECERCNTVVGDLVRHMSSIETADFLCGGCVVSDESASGDALAETYMELTDAGVILCNGIGYVPGGGRPLAEMAGWESSRLLQLGLDAQDIVSGSKKLISRVALLTESGWSTVLVVRFLGDGAIEMCFSGDTIGFVVGKGTAKPLGEAQIQQGVIPINSDDPTSDSYYVRNVQLDAGEWFCALTGSTWKNIPLSCIAQTCHDHKGAPREAADALIEAAECYGSQCEMAAVVIERFVDQAKTR